MIPYTVRQGGACSGLLVGLGLFLAVDRAAADPSEADRTTARALAAEGYEALERQDYATAEDRLRRADALIHAPTIVVDRAKALIGLGRLVEAYESYQLVMRETLPRNAPASWRQAVLEAEREVSKVEPRLAWLVLKVEGPSDPRVTIDGVPIPNESLGVRRPIDPGRRHGIRVTADGFVSGGRSITLKEAEQQEITVQLERPPAVELEEAKTPEPAPDAPSDDKARLPIPVWTAFGVGAAGLTFGTITGIIALGKHGELADRCPDDRCSYANTGERNELIEKRSSYRTFGTLSGIGFGVGVAGAATGVVLLLTKPKRSEALPTTGITLVPVVGPDHVGVTGRF